MFQNIFLTQADMENYLLALFTFTYTNMNNMTNKLAIIGGSGLYDIEEFKEREFLDIKTPWGRPSDKILKTKINNKEMIKHQKIHSAGSAGSDTRFIICRVCK